MQVTIIPADSLIIVDGVPIKGIDMAGIDPAIRAVQFDGGTGHIEFNDGSPYEMDISSVSGFQWLLDRHAAKREMMEARQADPYYGLDDAEALALARRLKLRELSQAMTSADAQSITVGEHTYFGGKQSSISLKGQYDLVKDYVSVFAPEEFPVTTVTYFDINGHEVTLPLESDTEIDGFDVVAQVAMAYSVAAFNYAAKVGAVRQATSMAEIEIITF